ncbi:integral membrane sensor signal transduction histidine kinase [Candidatus Nitrosoglobus terrae]|uniref:Integral membrane sensor signal transduction histidine kinase n=1 Tax=Candidatus Nitrosoglobus terrae TaxID=1630141 RepID=A0A1Q2SMC7_9GAMM|nr:cache domain-containing protein [Candidatus Nitrosoglobus terrae]BAW80272.1 integral membrane sensor signal transduction histidine kinase [Candidatus Nitrosoglobus terrae]
MSQLWLTIKSRWKIILLAIVPLIASTFVIVYTVRYQAIALEKQQQEVIKTTYLNSKDLELKSYITLAKRSITHLYDSGRVDTAVMEEAKAILAKLEYGKDGYFFVYDYQGNSLVHSRQWNLVGTNQWNLKDDQGKLVIQDLINRARTNDKGGFENYDWEKPSSHSIAPKRTYVITLPKWGWILGTGVYLDDIDRALIKVNSQLRDNIHSTTFSIIIIATFVVVLIIILSLVLNIRVDTKLSVADAKLKILAQRIINTQEEERTRVARELHDSVMNMLVGIKFRIEGRIIELLENEQSDSVRVRLEDIAVKLKDTLTELRRIVRDLHPLALDLGLKVAIEQLVLNIHDVGIAAKFSTYGEVDSLSITTNRALYRATQESLHNIKRHAHARHVTVKLEEDSACVQLTIQDDGIGFNVDHIKCDPKHGFGLHNMKERVESVGGELTITSSLQGTIVIIKVYH